MKICVINGSPKGKYSLTLQTVLYLQKLFSEHEFEVLDVGQKIKACEKDFSLTASALMQSDAIIFSYPVYTFIAPSQLHRFIELMKSSGVDFSGKYATQITTSKHFYDVTAHHYIEDNCFDMGMKVVRGLSADMEDLITDKGKTEAKSFFEYFVHCINNNISEPKPQYNHKALPEIPKVEPKGEKSQSFDTVIVADLKKDDERLSAMIDYFKAVYPYQTRLINLAEYPFAGGCLGCFNCAAVGKCIYQDGFDTFLRENIQKASAVVYAFEIKDHSMGSRFKMYDDRQFCNGHRTVTEGMPFAYIALGDYQSEANLRCIIDARCEVGHNFLAGVGFDVESLENTAKRLSFALENSYLQPRNFYGVGGMKIFRDLIWQMRGLMKADHQYYKKHGIYDFPQKKRWQMIKMCLLGALIRNPKVNKKMGNKMNEAMVEPYKKIINNEKE